jgi:hypothetical protein
MGPVLVFRGSYSGWWHLSCLITSTDPNEPPPLSTGTDHVRPHALARRCHHVLWRYDFAFPIERTPSDREYCIGEQTYRVHVPAAGAALHIAFTACNGSERDDVWTDLNDRNAMWLDLAQEHSQNPFHLLLQGGDQLYADPIWRKVPALSAWRRLPLRKRRDVPFSP